MNDFEVLVRAGLDKKSAAVFVALLDKGVMSLSDISRETHINRPALYELLPRMRARSLISVIQKQRRTFYKAESPARVLDLYTEDHREIGEKLSEMARTYAGRSYERPVIKYFEGERGITFVFDDVITTLPKGGIFYRYSSRTGSGEGLKNTQYDKVRDERGIERVVITSEEKAARKTKKLERAVKAIPREFDLFADNISLLIYGNKTAYIDYSSKTSFIVESEKIARFQEKIFRLLYKKL